MPESYVDSESYARMTGNQSSGTDGRLDALLESASRLYDIASHTAPGHWGPISSTAYRFSARGGNKLYLRDSRGYQYHLRTITADSLAIDTDGDGSFDDYTLDLSDAWVQALPENAVTFGNAYRSLDLLGITGATITAWPNAADCVRITGTWGYAVTPAAVQWRVIDIAHALSQRGFAGNYGTEEELQGSGAPMWVVNLVDRAYSNWIPAL